MEVDSKNIDAWIDKASSMAYLTTSTDDKFDEAISYLKKAHSITPENKQIKNVAEIIIKTRANWENKLGTLEFNKAIAIYNSINKISIPQLNVAIIAGSVAGKAINLANAKSKSLPIFRNAMFHYLCSYD